MHRPYDEHNPDDWDGTDHAEQSDLDTWLPNRKGQGSDADLEQRSGGTQRVDVYNEYTVDWIEISRQRKEIAGYRCSDCRLVLKGSHLLHTHHLDGNKAENHPSNLLVVCIDCHNRRHGFTYRAILAKDRELLDALRVEQGLPAWKP